MADDSALPDDIEEQRKLAANYQPTLTGPNVSAKKSLIELVERYAEGHKAYQAKTKNLAQHYSSLRFIKGDRKCGWRALLFVYCELLIKLEDEAKIKSEKTRLASLAPEMDILGEAHRGLWDDMCADAFNDLFDRLAAWIGKPDADKKLEAYFDDDEANHTLYGLRLFAGLAMKKDEEFYGMFIEEGVDDYCNKVLMLPDEEIEESGLRALNDILINPAGLSLEVLILHDNPGTDVDVSEYPPPAEPAHGGLFSSDKMPTVRLLFTPGHYDIIYKPSDDPPVVIAGA